MDDDRLPDHLNEAVDINSDIAAQPAHRQAPLRGAPVLAVSAILILAAAVRWGHGAATHYIARRCRQHNSAAISCRACDASIQSSDDVVLVTLPAYIGLQIGEHLCQGQRLYQAKRRYRRPC